MEIMYNLMQDKSINPPSPLRLLRLINVRRCEHCNQVATTAIHPDFGVALCKSTCLNPRLAEESFVREYRIGELPYAQELADHLRVFRIYRGTRARHLVNWSRQLKHGDEKCGPLVTVQELMEISESDNPVETFEARIPPEHLYHPFVSAFNFFVRQIERNAQELEERRRQEYYDAVNNMIGSIKSQLEEQWRDVALQTLPTANDNSSLSSSDGDGHISADDVNEFTFCCPAVEEILKQYVESPNGFSPAIGQQVAAWINEHFDSLVNFWNLPFLQEQEHPFDLQLKRYCRSVVIPDIQSLAFQSFATGEIMFESLRQDGGIRTLAQLLFKDKRICAESRKYDKWLHMLAAAHCAYYTAIDGEILLGETEMYERLCNGIACFKEQTHVLSDLDVSRVRNEEDPDADGFRYNNQEVLLKLRDTFGTFVSSSENGSPRTSRSPIDSGRLLCRYCNVWRNVEEFPSVGKMCTECMVASIRCILYVPACCSTPRDQMRWHSSES